jgi:hypothetical protein
LPTRTNHLCVGTPPLVAPRTKPILQDHHWRLVVQKLPGLSLAPTTVGASQITLVLLERWCSRSVASIQMPTQDRALPAQRRCRINMDPCLTKSFAWPKLGARTISNRCTKH